MLTAAVIVGSTRNGRFAPVVLNWFMQAASGRNDWRFEIVDLKVTPAPDALLAIGEPPSEPQIELLQAITPHLRTADAFVVVTPEYNRGYPAALKNAIDWHGGEWRAKPVAFISYGGVSGGLRAVEQLRLVFAELHATTIRDGVSFPFAWTKFDEHGAAIGPEGDRAAHRMLDQLGWWARALKAARVSDPYVAA